jgi:hypothetical protein
MNAGFADFCNTLIAPSNGAPSIGLAGRVFVFISTCSVSLSRLSLSTRNAVSAGVSGEFGNAPALTRTSPIRTSPPSHRASKATRAWLADHGGSRPEASRL